MPRLENWSIVGNLNHQYQAPDSETSRLEGIIFDDELKRFSDGRGVTTSRLVELDLENKIAQTKNTKYKLGEPYPNYLKWLEENNMTLKQYNYQTQK